MRKRLKEEVTKQIPQTYSEALFLAAEQAKMIELQEKEIKQLQPKADFYDTVTGASEDIIDISDTAKALNMGIGRNKLFEFLSKHKILMNKNRPYQQYVDRGWFRVIESSYEVNDMTHITLKTMVHQKGLVCIRELLLREKKKGLLNSKKLAKPE